MKSIVIIGQGPAGISSAIYTARAGIKTTVVANGTGALTKASKIENYYGFPEAITGMDLIERGIAQAKNLGVEFINEEVLGVEVMGSDGPKNFAVKTTNGFIDTDSVILATGTSRNTPKIQGIRKLDGKGVSYCAICDAFFYKGKDVAVLGSGDYALNEAKELIPLASSVSILTNGDDITANFPDSVKIYKTPVTELIADPSKAPFPGMESLTSVKFENGETIDIDGLFVGYGTADSFALAKKIGAFTEGNKIIVDENMATNVSGLFAAGDCTGGLLQIAKAVSDGAIAGNSAIKYLRK